MEEELLKKRRVKSMTGAILNAILDGSKLKKTYRSGEKGETKEGQEPRALQLFRKKKKKDRGRSRSSNEFLATTILPT